MAKKAEGLEAREAKHGQRMVGVKVRFWTDDIVLGKGKILPKHAWTSGVVRIERNEAHGILPDQNPVPFNSILEIGEAIAQVLIGYEIVLHPSRRDRKFIQDPPGQE